jgi:antitoxin VapB
MPIVSEKAAGYLTESPARHVRLFRKGANQAVRIPKEFELPGKEAIMRREGDRLIIEPAIRQGTNAGRIDGQLGRHG